MRGEGKIDDAGIASLASLEHLTSLDLTNTKITDAGLEMLATQKNLSNLELRRTSVTAAGIAALQAALPHNLPGISSVRIPANDVSADRVPG